MSTIVLTEFLLKRESSRTDAPDRTKAQGWWALAWQPAQAQGILEQPESRFPLPANSVTTHDSRPQLVDDGNGTIDVLDTIIHLQPAK